MAKLVQALIVTGTAQGSTIHVEGEQIDIPCVKPRKCRYPTGCGDAYRAGLSHGIATGLNWQAAGRLASLIGALKIETQGTQNH